MNEAGTWHGGRPQPRRLCVRWGPSPPHHKGGGAPSPIFGPRLLWPNGWMDEDAAWYGSIDLGPGHIVLDGVQAPANGAQQLPPLFGPCLLWPRSPISATAELLFCYLTLLATWWKN